MKKIKTYIIIASLFMISSLIPTLAYAFPEGQWKATFFSEVFGGSGTQGICIEAAGTWYGTTFSGWGGKWYKKGNDIHLHGNYGAGAGNDAFEMTRINNLLLTGYWQEWSDDGFFDNYLTIKYVRTGDICAPPLGAASSTNNPSEGQ